MIRRRAPDKGNRSAAPTELCFKVVLNPIEQGTKYKLFSIGRFSYIVPIMVGYNGGRNLVLYASNYIVYLYPTV